MDLITEARYSNGIIYLSVGSSIHELGNPGVAEVSTRVRMSLVTAQSLRAMLDDCIAEALKPVVDKSTGR